MWLFCPPSFLSCITRSALPSSLCSFLLIVWNIKGVTASRIKASAAQPVLYCSISSCRHSQDSHRHRERRQGRRGGGRRRWWWWWRWRIQKQKTIIDVKRGLLGQILQRTECSLVNSPCFLLSSCPRLLVKNQTPSHFHALLFKKAENTAAPKLRGWEQSPRSAHNRICWTLFWLLHETNSSALTWWSYRHIRGCNCTIEHDPTTLCEVQSLLTLLKK